MIVTNKDIAKDIAENMMVQDDVITTSVVKDMMYYMRDIYETKIKSLDTEVEILKGQSKPIEEILTEDELVEYNKLDDEENSEEYELANFDDFLSTVLTDVVENLKQTKTKEGK